MNLVKKVLNFHRPIVYHPVLKEILINYRYIKSNGEISVQKSISRERPSYRAKKVSCQAKLLQVVCQDDVVWVVTEARSILVRMGIKAGTEEGTDWTPLNKCVRFSTVLMRSSYIDDSRNECVCVFFCKTVEDN